MQSVPVLETERLRLRGYRLDDFASCAAMWADPIAWGEAHFGPSRTACIIDPENLRSIRVAEKCGYRKLQMATNNGKPTIVFVR
jgi:RimJ/RimL family protein N-acetyltransferase